MRIKPFTFALSFFLMTMMGCSTPTSSHVMGPTLDDEALEKLTPETTKQEVIDQYGQPSFRCFTAGTHNLCYFHQKKKNDQASEQRQLEIEFNGDNTIKEIRIYEPKTKTIERRTPSSS